MFLLFFVLSTYSFCVFLLLKKQTQQPSVLGGMGYLPHGAAISNRKFLFLSCLLFFVITFLILAISRLVSEFYYEGALGAIIVFSFISLLASIKLLSSEDVVSHTTDETPEQVESAMPDFFLLLCDSAEYVSLISSPKFNGFIEKTPFENILVASNDVLTEIIELFPNINAFPWSNEMHRRITEKFAKTDEICKEKIQLNLKLESELGTKSSEFESLLVECNELKKANNIINAALHEARAKGTSSSISPERMTKSQAEEELKKTKERIRLLEGRLQGA